MPSNTIPKLLYTVPEVVEATGFSRSFIYEHIKAGSLRVVRKGNTVRVKVDDLERWIENPD